MDKKKKVSLVLMTLLTGAALMLAAGYFVAIRRIGWGKVNTAVSAVEEIQISKLYIPDEMRASDYLKITDTDLKSLLDRYKLPELSRMDGADQRQLIEPLQVMRRIQVLGLNPDSFEYPETQYKLLYNEIRKSLESLEQEQPIVTFEGTKVSELNVFLLENTGKRVEILNGILTADETLLIPSDTTLVGNETYLSINGEPIDKAIVLDGISNVRVSGFRIDGGFNYGVYVKHSENYIIENNMVSRMGIKGLAIMGKNSCFILRNNQIYDNQQGGMFLNGDIQKGIVEKNWVEHNSGAGNLEAGIVLCSVDIKDENTVNNPLENIHIYDALQSPHDLVIIDNVVSDNHSSGCYSHGGYRNYLLQNHIIGNQKEGACLDYGSFGYYVAYNVIRSNGQRNHMSDEELKKDFILDFGRLQDGSSPAKVPGLSLDNAAYNIIYNNLIAENYGSGVKAVRSAYRNVILCNEVTDNNLGASENFHFFGIELASDMNEEEKLDCLDFTPCYENIIARNTISGAHYAGIFYGVDSYVNDSFDNIIMGTTTWGMESLSQKYNSVVNNICDRVNNGI